MIAFFIMIVAATAVILLIFIKSLQIPGKLKKAEELLNDDRLTEAAAIVKEVLDRQKDDIRARYLRARILQEQKQYLMAISEYNGILAMKDFQLYAPEAAIHYALAEMYGATSNYAKEIEEFRLILSFNPDDVKANNRLGMAYYAKSDYKRAREYLLKAVTLDSSQSECYLPLGISLFNVGSYDKAEEYLLKNLDLFPDDSESRYYLGCIYKAQKSDSTALSMFMQARTDKKYALKSIYQMGEIFFEEENYSRAISTLEEGINSVNDSTEDGCAFRYLLASCYENDGRIADAIKHWDIIVKHSPNYRNAKSNLESYRNVTEDENLMEFFSLKMEDVQSYITDIINSFNYNIISKELLSPSDCQYKAYNMKRIGDPPVLILYTRTISDISEMEINDFYRRMLEEKCKTGMILTTAGFSPRIQGLATSRQIELYDGRYLSKALEKIRAKKLGESRR